jgi:hypothetical protein
VGEVVTSERVPELEIIGHFGSCSLASEQSDLKTDLMVVELGTLFPELVAEIRQLIQHTGAERSIVVYHFASTKTATGLARAIPGLILFKAPVGRGSITPGVFGSVECLECNRSGRAN